jgi:PTS system nitrogen regulatory IIA component
MDVLYFLSDHFVHTPENQPWGTMQLTVRDVAKLFFVSEKTVYRWIEQSSLPAYRVNQQYRFNRAELMEWATTRRINFSPEIFDENESKSAPLPGVVESLQSGGIHYRVSGTDKESVLRSVVDLMRLPEEVDHEFLFRVLLAREALGSTGVGNGIAIPHVRNPVVLHVPRPSITLCFLDQPVDFSAIDGQPVHTLFSLISPTVRAHLHMLSRLAYFLRDAGFTKVILQRGSREEIIKEASRVEAGLQHLKPGQGKREKR